LPDPLEPPCTGRTNLFFSTSPLDRRRAQGLCAPCPYTRSCAELAVRYGERTGVWGGLDFGRASDRRAARSRPRLKAG
jgi:hypothetical protein